MTASQLPKRDRRYDLLAAPRRRHLLSLLCEHDRLNLEVLTVELTAREIGVVDGSVPADARRRVRIALVHNHLPRLADHDLVAYDLQTGTIVPAEGFDALEPTVERLCDRSSTASEPAASD
ncbi:hypothetical protein OB955_13440 [Halobacteria archaeon AArc-m2/3/4]|uniref:DUF7344 domain-containing protein n=1 Tax=Natronoglomus mannanivorans TaxID=2979990 RepID=A0AAP2YY43_9EURY|nr:hypothetical protein [Halobacteria archaeon AArc-xg1-1]MCU4973739.1 hypothetical protein [Halobacteria archaeon AArc-m2/3/4]